MELALTLGTPLGLAQRKRASPRGEAGTSGFLCVSDHFVVQKVIRQVFNYYLLKYFLMVFLFVFFFWDSYDSNVGVFNIVPEVSEVVLISFNSFFFFPLCFIYFYHSIFYLTYRIFYLHYSTVGSLQSVQWLKLCSPNAGGLGWIPGPGKVYIPQGK